MPTTVRGRGVTATRDAAWEVARPPRAFAADGVAMAGFRGRSIGPVEVPVVPHPGVTLVVEFGAGPLAVEAAAGRRQHGSFVAAPASGAVRLRGERIACLEVRLSPLGRVVWISVASRALARTLAAPAKHPSTSSTRALGRRTESTHQT
ncbi:hypothetical protein ACFVST_25100, partial [Streptomyces sp. NPDC058045]